MASGGVGEAELEIVFDEEGLERLEAALEAAVRSGHEHMFGWGASPDVTASPDTEAACFPQVLVAYYPQAPEERARLVASGDRPPETAS